MTAPAPAKSILFVQNGDFREAYRRFAAGGEETYRDQKRSVDFVAGLAPEARVTTAAFGPEAYRDELAPNLHATGLQRAALDAAGIARLLDEAAPDRVVLRTPHPGFLRAIRRRRIPVLPVFADIFTRGSLRAGLRHRRLRRGLNGCRAPCIANHSLNASRSLVEVLGLDPARVVPWDWSRIPMAGPAKPGVADPTRPQLFFAGGLSPHKGVGDCIEALVHLGRSGLRPGLTIAGTGDTARWQARAAELGVGAAVRFLGRIPNARVRREMRAHDFVVVPSRPSYPEGLPNTIYEGLASRSVLAVSDHPAFAGRLVPDEEALEFPAADPQALARRLEAATSCAALYRRLSENAAKAHDRLYIGLEWTELVATFLQDPEDRTGWVARNAFASLPPAGSATRRISR